MSQHTVLVVGGGGREHALAKRLLESPSVAKVVVAPGNAGTSLDGLESASGQPLELAKTLGANLVVVGPEGPLCDGLVDQLSEAGILTYGPSQRAAELEASKAFMKDFATRHGIRTARHVTVNRSEELDAALAQFQQAPVVKASGLCAGKGVIMAESLEQARQAALEMLSGSAFGEAGAQVVLEERLYGQEASIHAICDGERALMLPAIQDHKRIGEGDTGPNTGGMGTYGPAPVVTPELAKTIKLEVVDRIVSGMKADGAPFKGTLFTNLMISPEGEAVLLEINVRFGDPETQVLMNLLDGDFYRLLESAAQGALDESAVNVSLRHGLCVVLAAANYPETPRKGDAITGLTEAQQQGAIVYHAGTRLEAGQVLTSGGRVLGVTAVAENLQKARDKAYAACERIHFEGMQFRRDIGHLALD